MAVNTRARRSTAHPGAVALAVPLHTVGALATTHCFAFESIRPCFQDRFHGLVSLTLGGQSVEAVLTPAATAEHLLREAFTVHFEATRVAAVALHALVVAGRSATFAASLARQRFTGRLGHFSRTQLVGFGFSLARTIGITIRGCFFGWGGHTTAMHADANAGVEERRVTVC